mmetsp:Transcript_51867/g.97298  ORF Transcript_51867/g.97298 Transcript_51867/m.97298 type:complete len:1271 (+) Transcript_51867:54-3866(+)
MPQLLKRLGSITPRCRRADPVLPFSDLCSASPDGEGSPDSKEPTAHSPTPKTKVITDRSPYVVRASPDGSTKKQRLSFSAEDQPCAALPMPMSPVSATSTSSKQKKQPRRAVNASPGCVEASPGSSAKKPRRAALEQEAEPEAGEPVTARRRLELGVGPTPVKEAASPETSGNYNASPEVGGVFGKETGQSFADNFHMHPTRLFSELANLAYFGLSEDASDKDLDNAYRQMAKRMHPDKNGGTEESKQRFQEMQKRYEALKEKRGLQEPADAGSPGDAEEVATSLDLRATAAAELGRPPMGPLSSADQPPPQELLGVERLPDIRPASARATVGPRTPLRPITSGGTVAAESAASCNAESSTTSPERPRTSPAPAEAFAPRAPPQPRRPQTARPSAPRPPQALARASSSLLSSAAKAATSAASVLTPRRLMSPGRLLSPRRMMSPGRLMSPRRMMSPGRVMTPRPDANPSEETPDATSSASISGGPAAAKETPQTQPRTPRSWLPSPRPSFRRGSKPPVGHQAATAAAEATPPRSAASRAANGAGVGPLDTSEGEEADDADPLVNPMLSAVYGRPLTREEVSAAVSVCPEVSWLAQCALMCPLPPGWRQCNGDGADGVPPILYACDLTGEVNEQPPHLQRFSRLARLLMTSVQRPEDTAAAAAWLEREIQDAHSEATRMKESWTQSIDPARGVKFWHDPVSRRSCWENPAAPAEFIACVAERLLATEAFAKLASTADAASSRADSARSDAAVRADSARRSKPRAQSGTPRAPYSDPAASPAPTAAAAPPPAPGTSRRVRKPSGQSSTGRDASMEASACQAGEYENAKNALESKRRSRSKRMTSSSEPQTARRCVKPPALVPKISLAAAEQDDDTPDDNTPKARVPGPPKQCTDFDGGDTEAFAIFTPPGSPAKLPVESKPQSVADLSARSSSQPANGDAASALAGAAAALAVAAAALASARGPASDSAPEVAYDATLRPSEAYNRSQIDADARRQVLEEACLAQAEEETRQRAETEAREKAEEQARLQAQLQAEEVRRKLEEEARQKAAEEAQQKAEEAVQRRAEEEARRRAEEEARQKAEEEVRKRTEEEARQKAEEEARQKAQLKAEEEARKKAQEELRRKAAEEARQRAEEEARLRAEAQQKAKEEAAKLKAEADFPLAASPAKKLTVPAMPGREAASPARKLTVPAMPGMEADAPHAGSPAKKLTMQAMPGTEGGAPRAASPSKKLQTPPRTKLTVPAMPSPAGLKLSVPPMPMPAGSQTALGSTLS